MAKTRKDLIQELTKNQACFDFTEDIMEPGTLDISISSKLILSETLSQTKASRWEISAKISELTGRDVSKHMLDNYCSELKTNYRLPVDLLPALIIATSDFRLLSFLNNRVGCSLLKSDEAILSEIVKMEKRIAKMKKQKDDLQALYLKLK